VIVRLTLYGDFNCPYSALASARVDALRATGRYEIEWRAVQHDRTIPVSGEVVIGDVARELAAELAEIEDLAAPDLQLVLRAPPVRPNTALASTAFAANGSDTDDLRRRLFAALWTEGRNLGDADELHRLGALGRNDEVARAWQDGYDALAHPMTPTLVEPNGQVCPGRDALARLSDLANSAAN
jgi:predicted DsbA family dithiol-disulfide isomerase